jgi:proteasome lid subunit RPN8/RPN11
MDGSRVFIVEDVFELLRNRAERARPVETGGVLAGVLRDGDPWITAAIEVIDEGRTSSRFVIPAGVTPLAIDAARSRDSRVGYVGDWHSHPANVPASSTDKATLRRNAGRRHRLRQLPAILIVVRDTEAGWQLDVVRDFGVGPTPAEYVLTGPLPSWEDPDYAR